MPEIQAFRGLRYDLGHVGSLSDVIAPPYDVIGPQLQEQLYKRHPANVIRLILNRDEPGDDATNNRYSRAAQFLKNWRGRRGAGRRSRPAVYVYHQGSITPGRRTRGAASWRVSVAAFRRGEHLSARRNHVGPQAGSPAADPRLQDKPEPDLRPVPRRQNEAQKKLEAAATASRRSRRPTTWV